MHRRTFLQAAVLGPLAMNAQAAQQPSVARAADADAAETFAADELARWLGQALGFPLTTLTLTADDALPDCALIVGRLAHRDAPDVDAGSLDEEAFRLYGRGGRLRLQGGGPRGTLYAVYWFLQQQVGVRWWTPWATDVPVLQSFAVPDLDVRIRPGFESRDPSWYHTWDGDWAARNFVNSASARLTEAHGGRLRYAHRGFVHTYFSLVPPAEHFQSHPEWYSLVQGRRTWEKAQLCTTNASLRAFLVERVRQSLRAEPEARIISISQNDQRGPCECGDCAAIDQREGSYSGTVLALVNHIAQALGTEFPKVAFDTLAYQYTRKAPRTLRPLPNVIVRLCSIECNFREPLHHASNRSFADDLAAWSRICSRLYVWDYTTNFAHSALPHPNWFVLGENVRYFASAGVRGVFEQGAHISMGAEMAEMRAWVLAQLLRDPTLDDGALIREFLDGYYGVDAASRIRRYMDLLHEASAGYYLNCFAKVSEMPFMNFRILRQADELWRQSLSVSAADDIRHWRVQLGYQSIRYAVLTGWTRLRGECRAANEPWPFGDSVQALADAWVGFMTTPGPSGWEPMRFANEWRKTPREVADYFVARASSPE